MSPGLNWVNEYNFVAGLQTWPNLNSQQRKSGNRKLGWIEFSSVRDYWFVRGKSASDFKSQKRWLKWRTENRLQPEFRSIPLISCHSFWLLRGRKASLLSYDGSSFWKATSSYTRLFWHLGRLCRGWMLIEHWFSPAPPTFPWFFKLS